MSITTVDCSNMTCPAPVIAVRNLLQNKKPQSINVIVDNDAAYQNVRRFLEYNGYTVSRSDAADKITISAVSSIANEQANIKEEILMPEIICDSSSVGSVSVLITSNRIGHGDDDLGEMLMFNFLKTLKEIGQYLQGVYLLNNGVKFAVEESEALPILAELEGSGVKIRSCGACLGYFHLLDKLAVGEVTNMLEIVTAMKESGKVITV